MLDLRRSSGAAEIAQLVRPQLRRLRIRRFQVILCLLIQRALLSLLLWSLLFLLLVLIHLWLQRAVAMQLVWLLAMVGVLELLIGAAKLAVASRGRNPITLSQAAQTIDIACNSHDAISSALDFASQGDSGIFAAAAIETGIDFLCASHGRGHLKRVSFFTRSTVARLSTVIVLVVTTAFLLRRSVTTPAFSSRDLMALVREGNAIDDSIALRKKTIPPDPVDSINADDFLPKASPVPSSPAHGSGEALANAPSSPVPAEAREKSSANFADATINSNASTAHPTQLKAAPSAEQASTPGSANSSAQSAGSGSVYGAENSNHSTPSSATASTGTAVANAAESAGGMHVNAMTTPNSPATSNNQQADDNERDPGSDSPARREGKTTPTPPRQSSGHGNSDKSGQGRTGSTGETKKSRDVGAFSLGVPQPDLVVGQLSSGTSSVSQRQMPSRPLLLPSAGVALVSSADDKMNMSPELPRFDLPNDDIGKLTASYLDELRQPDMAASEKLPSGNKPVRGVNNP